MHPPSQQHQETLRFQKLKGMPNTSEAFNAVFGDCFISGFLEGGEFTALVSLRFWDDGEGSMAGKEGRALAKLALSPRSGDEEVTAARKALTEKAEVSVNVSWAGGGNIKDEGQWDIDSILSIAARFPEMVSRCPQRIAAVLTKYTTLRSFLEQMPGIVPLDYDNTVLYSGDLLDAYMEYKHMVRQLNQMLADPSAYVESTFVSREEAAELKPIRLLPSELDDAKTYCRTQMLRIVKEVDNIAKNPALAMDEEHIPPFMSAELFRAMLPVHVSSAEKLKGKAIAPTVEEVVL